MAIEDAAWLAAFAQARRARVGYIRRESGRIGKAAQWHSRPAVRLRNRLVRMLPESAHDRQHERILGAGQHDLTLL